MYVRFKIRSVASAPKRALSYMGDYNITKIDERQWIVAQIRDPSKCKYYKVIFTDSGFARDCPDFKFRGNFCKHIYHVMFNSTIHKTLATILLVSRPELNSYFEIVQV